MGRRIAYLALAIALCSGLVACYDVPQPACGFVCGTGGACPDDYTCNPSINRCVLNGAPSTGCLGVVDAGIDSSDGPGIDMGGNTPPSVLSTSPADMATGVAVTTTVSATFSEDVFGVNGSTFTLSQGAQQVVTTFTFMSGANPVATLTPAAQLLPSTTYTASLSSSIVDTGGAPLPAKSWTFTTAADTAGPMVVARSPMPNATGVALNATVTAQFNENVMGVSGTTFTLANGGTPIAGTVTYSAGTRTATFTPSAALPPSTLLTATLTSGITDTSSNALMNAPVTWTFTTAADTTAPTVTMRMPAPNATMVPLSTTIAVQFSEPVMGVTTSSFTVNDGAAVAGTLASTMGGREWTFTPSAAFAANDTVTVTLTTAIQDSSGNALAAPVTWMFTTAPDTTAPTVTLRSPAANATMVATNTTIVATFDEPVTNVTTSTFTVNAGGAIAGTLASGMGGRQWTFTPSAALANNTAVTVTLTTGITDLASNALASPVTWMFTTIPDTMAPTVMTRTPAPNATMVATSTTIVATFDEPVMGVTTTSFTVNDGAAVTGTLASSNGGRTWTFTPSAPLANSATVTATLTTAITDLAGNALASPVMWTFTTVPDTTAPTVMTRTPAPGAGMVAQSSTVVVTFSEPVTNVAAGFNVMQGLSQVAGTLASSNGGRTWTFTPTMMLAGGTSYTVSLTNAITDLASNPLSGAPVSWAFTTAADMVAPSVQSSVPANGTVGAPTSTTITVNFSEPVMNVTAATFTVNDGAAVTGTLMSFNNGAMWTFTPSANLAAAATVTVMLSAAITDLGGNPLPATTITFTTP